MPSFSPEEAQEYVEAGGDYCPACKGNNITAGESEWVGNQVGKRVTCEDCGCVWYDWFTLKHAKPRDAYEAQKAEEDALDTIKDAPLTAADTVHARLTSWML